MPNLSLDAIVSIHSVHSVYISYFKQFWIFNEQIPLISLNKSSSNYGSTQYFYFSQKGFGQDSLFGIKNPHKIIKIHEIILLDI